MNSDTVYIGYQGVEGSYSHEALLEYFGEAVKTINVNTFEEVFIELNNGNISYGVLPIENSSTGGISEVIDLLYKYDVSIVGEYCLKINHSLLGIPGAQIKDIEEVYSHPQAFMQSKEFLKEYSEWKLISYFNTAKSVEFIKSQNNKKFAAVASKKTAQLYGVDIIKENINFNTNNYTRFIIINKDLQTDEKNDKISIVLSIAHKSGALFEIIKCIADQGLNMLKIESRPIINIPWEYLFYIDFEGNMKDSKVQKAIELIREYSIQLKLLGNYKAHK